MLWTLLPLLPAFTSFELNNMFGIIQSPGFPNPYGNNLKQNWNISVPGGFVIKLYFSYFSLELSYLCEHDYIKIVSDGVELARLCGQNSTDTEDAPSDKRFYSTSNNMTVTFHTDYSNENSYPGFVAHYAAEDVDECNLPDHEQPSCDHYCHNYLGGYHCSCKLGYFLDSDGRNCRESRIRLKGENWTGGVHVGRDCASHPQAIPLPQQTDSCC
ncbi:mannan-binding lectin serine protease 1 isoform X2 [Callorhinchus milii]|uniref:mannan-binding lectin serine protease 1 isoform X2 n=1 Tax=Callorhinchus milii TaxID=7868 RepID=UPI00045712F5|nr:mannan-binding lectin serine protease 1 isoform X2 [Callorhinchus milii]|eukprot:gi/632960054/ref/XP_007895977.1/ PREDICTED: mannan-binding lectin serine protease 2 isoform X2 [Callorhinchus milii]